MFYSLRIYITLYSIFYTTYFLSLLVFRYHFMLYSTFLLYFSCPQSLCSYSSILYSVLCYNLYSPLCFIPCFILKSILCSMSVFFYVYLEYYVKFHVLFCILFRATLWLFTPMTTTATTFRVMTTADWLRSGLTLKLKRIFGIASNCT